MLKFSDYRELEIGRVSSYLYFFSQPQTSNWFTWQPNINVHGRKNRRKSRELKVAQYLTSPYTTNLYHQELFGTTHILKVRSLCLTQNLLLKADLTLDSSQKSSGLASTWSWTWRTWRRLRSTTSSTRSLCGSSTSPKTSSMRSSGSKSSLSRSV